MGTVRGVTLAATLLVSLLPAAPTRAACGDIYPAMALGPFHAQTTPPLFYGVDDAVSGSFNVQWTGFTCGGTYSVTAAYADAPGSATEPADYTMSAGRTPPVGVVGPPGQEDVAFPIANEGSPEQVAESFTIVLSEPAGGSIDAPPSAPFVLVDADGATARVAFDDLPYSQTETFNTLVVPVWLAGSAAGAVVPYTVGPGPGAGATPNDDFTVMSPNPLVFSGGDRVELITLSVVNDTLSEGDEAVQIDLQGAVSPSSKVVTIQDNEENVAPTSRIHHPRHKWRYKKGD